MNDKFTWQPDDIVFLDEQTHEQADDIAAPQVSWSPDNLDERLAEYQAQGVEYLKWLCQSNCCDLCFANDGQVRKVGDAFANSAVLPQCHPNCACDVTPVEGPNG